MLGFSFQWFILQFRPKICVLKDSIWIQIRIFVGTGFGSSKIKRLGGFHGVVVLPTFWPVGN
jgi:hypothetical protein